MSDERDTRVECLRPGDQVRCAGTWFDVVTVRPGTGRHGAFVAIEVDELVHGPDGVLRRRCFVRPFGAFVAAECNPRIDTGAASAAELYEGAR